MKSRLVGAFRIGSALLCLCLGLAGSFEMAVQAETLSRDWKVELTSENKMESNFTTGDIGQGVSDLQPGDEVVFTISLENSNPNTADWYVSNKALSSMADNSGGAYSYELRYNDRILFNSDTVGGDVQKEGQKSQGLSAATDTLKDYVYLDTLKTGQKGSIILTVGLEGESQGNPYQGSYADLELQFAAELAAGTTGGSGGSDEAGGGADGSGESGGASKAGGSESNGIRTQVVRTGDDTNLTFWFIIAGVSGIVLLLLGFYTLIHNRKEEKEG